MLDGDELTVLEANAIPGLTDTSLLPLAAEAAGIGFDAFVARVLDLAVARMPPGLRSDDRAAEGCSPLGIAAGEVLGRHAVEELLELVDDLFGVLDLVLELDRRLGDHVLGGEDRRAGAHGQRQCVGRAGSRSRPRVRSLTT